jgi:hypothetical protein
MAVLTMVALTMALLTSAPLTLAALTHPVTRLVLLLVVVGQIDAVDGDNSAGGGAAAW